MRILVIFLLIISLTLTLARPAPAEVVEEGDAEEAAYDNEAEAGNDEDVEEEEEPRRSRVNESGLEEQEEDRAQNQLAREDKSNSRLQRPSAEELASKSNNDDFSVYRAANNKLEEEISKYNYNSHYQPPTDHRDTSRFIDKFEESDTKDSVRNFLVADDLKTSESKDKQVRASNNEDILFESQDNNKPQSEKITRSEYNKPWDSNRAGFSKKFISSENRVYFNRDRRAIDDTNATDTYNTKMNDELKSLNNEDEETAIKRHVKKLSASELNELMNSLSEDKRELLKKIIESDPADNNNFSKREITRKTGAAPEGNSYSDVSVRSDVSRLQDSAGELMTSGTSESSAGNQSMSQQEMTALPIQKLEGSNETLSLTSDMKGDLSMSDLKPNNEGNTIAPADSGNPGKSEANAQESKNENKRETNSDFEAFDEEDLKFEEDFNIRDSQELSNDLGSDESPSNKNGNALKREANDYKESELAESVKSLEESFPNSNSYDDNDPYFGSDMAPLVRVKRKNSDSPVKKRAAGILPDAKVAFFPYKSENDDEDNDEGNEFDDEGFYERNANIEKNEESASNLDVIQSNSANKNDAQNIINRAKISESNNMEKDKMSVGSDTDSVLSGVEGVDDTLMFNSASRNKRTAVEGEKEDPSLISNSNRGLRSTPMPDDEIKTNSGNNAIRYQESEAFGPLPRSYEGELGRYKRIRRVKQPAGSDVASSNT